MSPLTCTQNSTNRTRASQPGASPWFQRAGIPASGQGGPEIRQQMNRSFIRWIMDLVHWPCQGEQRARKEHAISIYWTQSVTPLRGVTAHCHPGMDGHRILSVCCDPKPPVSMVIIGQFCRIPVSSVTNDSLWLFIKSRGIVRVSV